MFSLLKNSNDNNDNNDNDLTGGSALLDNINNKITQLLPSFNLMDDTNNDNESSVVEGMGNINSNQGDNTIAESNISKANDEFNNLILEYTRNHELLLTQILQNQSNPLLQKYAGKNVKLDADNSIHYVNRFGFLQKYKNFGKRPHSCDMPPIDIKLQDFLKFPKGEELGPQSGCGYAGNNIKNVGGRHFWFSIDGKRFDYKKGQWDNRITSCKEANLLNAPINTVKGIKSSGDMNNMECNTLNIDPSLMTNVRNLNKKLISLAKDLLVDIGKLNLKDNASNLKIVNTRNKINEKLKKLENDEKELAGFNSNLEELRNDTSLRVTSNYTRYLVWLIIALSLIALTVYTLMFNNQSILAQGVILFVCVYAIYLFLKSIFNMIF